MDKGQVNVENSRSTFTHINQVIKATDWSCPIKDSKIVFVEDKTLLEIGKELLAESDVNHVLTVAMDHLIEIAGAEHGMIILFDDSGDILFETARNLKKKDINRPEFEISHTIINKVKVEGTPICLHNALENPSLKKSKSTANLKILAVICLPLVYKVEIFGVVYLDNRAIWDAFKPDMCNFIKAFVDFISLAAFHALERKWLHNRVCSFEEELRGKYKFGFIVGHLAVGSRNERLRSYLKAISKSTWKLVNWLTHAQNAVRFDGSIATEATENVLESFMTA